MRVPFSYRKQVVCPGNSPANEEGKWELSKPRRSMQSSDQIRFWHNVCMWQGSSKEQSDPENKNTIDHSRDIGHNADAKEE